MIKAIRVLDIMGQRNFFKRNTNKLHVCDAYILEYGAGLSR
jgi:hypothetical protein